MRRSEASSAATISAMALAEIYRPGSGQDLAPRPWLPIAYLIAGWLGYVNQQDVRLIMSVISACAVFDPEGTKWQEAECFSRAPHEDARDLLRALHILTAKQQPESLVLGMTNILRRATQDPFGYACATAWDAIQLASLLGSPGVNQAASRSTTWSARAFVRSRSYLSFDGTTPVESFVRYRLHEHFDSFCVAFLDALRQKSIPDWEFVQGAKAKPTATSPFIEEYVAHVLRKPASCVRLSAKNLQRIRREHTIEHLLRSFVLKGYLLHGSPFSVIGELIPHQGNCLTASETGNQHAVYLTTHPMTAIFRATRKIGLNLWIGDEGPFSHRVFAGDKTLVRAPGRRGYVYVVPGQKDPSLVAKEPCRPICRVPVLPSDFIGTIHEIPDYEAKCIELIGYARRKLLLGLD